MPRAERGRQDAEASVVWCYVSWCVAAAHVLDRLLHQPRLAQAARARHQVRPRHPTCQTLTLCYPTSSRGQPLPCVSCRCGSGYLQTARQLEALSLLSQGSSASSSLSRFEQAQAVNQHHDAVAGTAKQHVAYDYAMRVRYHEPSPTPLRQATS